MTHALRSIFVTAMIVAIASFGMASEANAAKKKKIDQKVVEGLVEFHEIVNGSEDLIADAAGILLFPSVKKGGIGIGGESGSGALIIDGETVAYYRTSSASIGFQLGYQSRRQLFIFLTQDALDNFRNSENWEIGADASIAIVTLDAGGTIDTETIDDPVLAFIYGAKGLMYNLTLEGTKVSRINPK